MTVLYTGVALGQPDLDVWLCLIQKVGQKFMDPDMKTVTLELRPSQFMREIGRTGGESGRIGSSDRDWLVKSLLRLTGSIVIQSPDRKKGIMGRLVTRAAWNDDQDRLLVEIDNFVGYLFSSGYSQMNLGVRKTLMGDDLSLWLQAFISSHKKSGEFFYSVETLMARCRSRTPEPRKFKYRVSEKMRRLMGLSPSERGFQRWLWDGDILRVFFSEIRCIRWLDEHPDVRLPREEQEKKVDTATPRP